MVRASTWTVDSISGGEQLAVGEVVGVEPFTFEQPTARTAVLGVVCHAGEVDPTAAAEVHFNTSRSSSQRRNFLSRSLAAIQ